MLRLMLIVMVLCALVLTACVQPTPTPDTSPVATNSDPSLNGSATATPEGYPVQVIPTPTVNLTAYPAP
jgi:hypothetical protein